MNRRVRKTITLSLAMLLTVGLFPVMTFASESNQEVETALTSSEEVEEIEEIEEIEENVQESNGHMSIVPLSLHPPGIAFTVRDSASEDVLLQAGMYAPTSQPPYNLARITDRGFDLNRWPGWRVRNWNSNYIFGIPATDFGEQVILRMGTGLTHPPPLPYETIPEIPNSSELLGSNFEWLAHPTFNVWIEPIPPNIVKTLETKSPIYPGDILNFSITVSNPAILPNLWGQVAFPGPHPFPEALGLPISTASFDDFRVIDNLEAAGLILIEDSVTVVGERGEISNQSCQTDNILNISLNLPHATDEITPGAVTIKFQAQVPITAIPGVPITNTAKLLDSKDNLVDDSSVTSEIEKPPIPKIKIEKSVSQTSVDKGTDVTYTLVTTNTGEETLNDVVVTDILDDYLTNPRKENSTHGTCSFLGQVLTVKIGTLEPGEYATVTFVVTIGEDVKLGIDIPNIAYTSGEGDISGITVTDEDPVIITVPEPKEQEEDDIQDDSENDNEKDEEEQKDQNDQKDEDGNDDAKETTPQTGDDLLMKTLGHGVALTLSAACIFHISKTEKQKTQKGLRRSRR